MERVFFALSVLKKHKTQKYKPAGLLFVFQGTVESSMRGTEVCEWQPNNRKKKNRSSRMYSSMGISFGGVVEIKRSGTTFMPVDTWFFFRKGSMSHQIVGSQVDSVFVDLPCEL